MVEITAREDDKEKRRKRIEDRDFWDNIKCTKIWIIGVPEEEEKKKGVESLFRETMAENSPNLGRKMGIQAHET